MKPFNQLLHDDINMLHGIDRGKFPMEYRRAFANIMKRYKISRSTVYAELDKPIPGGYKKRDDRSRHIVISKKEIELLKCMVSEGKTIRHISKTMSLELGFRYTPYRIYKVKELTASGKKISGKEPVIEPSASRFSARLLEEGNIAPVAMEDKPIEFKGNIRRLFYRLSMIDLIDPERALKINISGNIIQVSSRTIKNCFAYMVYSALHNGSDIPGSCRFEMEAILISELESIRLGNKLTPSALRQLEGIRRSLHALPKSEDSSALNGGYNMDDIYRAVSHFSPNTTRDQVVKFMEGVVE